MANRTASLPLRLAAAFDTLDAISAAQDELPHDIGEAETMRDQAMAILGLPGAWKLGATIPSVRGALGLSDAFFGVLPSSRVFYDGADLTPIQARQRGVECEYAFRLARDLVDGDDGLASPAFRELFASVHPAIEIPGTRFEQLGCYGGLGLVADFGAAGALVVGEGQALGDPGRLDAMSVQLTISDGQRAEGGAEVIEGGAFGPLRAFVHSAFSRGYRPKAGQFVVSGSCTGYVLAAEGAQAVARFEGLDRSVALRFAPGVDHGAGCVQ